MEIAKLVEFYVGRAQHLLRLAEVSDVVTLARYIAAVHAELGPGLLAELEILDRDPAVSDIQ